MTRTPMQPDDLPAVAALCRATLRPWLDRDWSVTAGDLDIPLVIALATSVSSSPKLATRSARSLA